ncbi:3/1,6-mannosyltransferase ALG2,Alpha-1 [Trichinella pseudospiralis]
MHLFNRLCTKREKERKRSKPTFKFHRLFSASTIEVLESAKQLNLCTSLTRTKRRKNEENVSQAYTCLCFFNGVPRLLLSTENDERTGVDKVHDKSRSRINNTTITTIGRQC